MKNRFATNCNICNIRIPAEHGTLTRAERFGHTFWLATCPDCTSRHIDSNPENISDVFRFNGGHVAYRNKAGRCEDAPCCGCCTI